MQFHSKTLAAALVIAAALATPALAQFNGQPAPNATGNPFGGTPNPPGANPFGAAPNPRGGSPFGTGHSPFAAGTVSAVNAAAGTITLTPMFGDGSGQTVKVTDGTTISAQTLAKVADLKVGDTVQVRGVPTGINASQITAGDSADSGMGGPFGGGRPNGGPGGMGSPGIATAQASGKITSLSPLTIAISEDASVVLKTTADVRVIKTVTEKISDIKVGDRVMANGQSGDDGVLSATQIHINLDSGSGRPPAPRPMPQSPMPPPPAPGNGQ